jgi:hypothetical protein
MTTKNKKANTMATDTRIAILEAENTRLRAEVERGRQRVAGDGSENCIFCATISGTGHAQDVPMCRLCELESQLATERERVKALDGASRGMLENYLELKNISLILAKSDAPGWIGRGMTVDDDVHVQAVRAALTTPPGATEETE